MTVRLLAASILALAILLAVTALLWVTSPGFSAVPTRWGVIPTVDLLGIAVAMGIGGWVARRGFGGVAVALVVALWVSTLASAFVLAPPHAPGVAEWLLRNNVAELGLSMLVAWLSARAGATIAARWPPPALRGLDTRR